MNDLIRRYEQFVVPNYGRFPLALSHGKGCEVWDTDGERYLDMGAGIAVCCLGHAHPVVARELAEQARRLIHASNLYYLPGQGELAERLVGLIGPGRMFFCNSGAEANETLFKLARRYGHESGRFEILTCRKSFHGRTLAGIAATGQEKVKRGFGPIVPGFRHVEFNNLSSVEESLSPGTVAVMVEGIQGEGGIHPATPEFLLGLRRLCDERDMLLLFDGVQCGHFRTGYFQSYERLLADVPDGKEFLPDAVGMAKSLGGGFPMGAVWIRDEYSKILGPGSHGTTFGGTPLACRVALTILDVIGEEDLAENAVRIGNELRSGLERLAVKHGNLIREIRGLGLMLGVEFNTEAEVLKRNQGVPSLQMVEAIRRSGMLTIPAGESVVRLLPPLNLSSENAGEAVEILSRTLDQL